MHLRRRSKNKIKLLFYLLICITSSAFSQQFVLKGKVQASDNSLLPFATIYIKGSSIGTNTNENGVYQLILQKGKYEIVFQYVGYAKRVESVELNSDKTLDIKLENEGISLKEIEVNAAENPANRIIREAIKKRKYYRNQLHEYSCETYIKGLQRLKHISKNTMALIKMADKEIKDSSKLLGVIYLSESQSDFFYREPDQVKEVMKSSKVSGSSRAFSFNQYRYLNYNFYNNMVEMKDVSKRPFVSPISENAFLYYKYVYLGSIYEDGTEINKIEVIPKRSGDPTFSGTIYIQEKTWRITGINLTLTKENKISFVDTIHIKQVYKPISGDSVWMPASVHMTFFFKIFGFTGGGYFNTVLYNYNIQPNLPKEFFKRELINIEKDANKKDSVYWNENRPIPLTEEEKKDYHKKDSVAAIIEDPKYIDSVDRRHNRFKIGDILNGYTYRLRNKNLELKIPGIMDAGVQYNTVEGINLSLNFSYFKSYEDLRRHRLDGRIRYGFSNKLLGGELDWRYIINHNKFRSFGFSAKSIATQYNGNNPITPLINTVYTLFLNDNFMKTFRESAIGGFYRTELYPGINARTELKFIERQPLFNTSNLLIRDDPHKLFTSNDPLHKSTEDSLFKTNDALIFDFNLGIRFAQKYNVVAGSRFYTNSKWPRFNLFYRKAIPVNNRSADFDLIGLTMRDEIDMKLFGEFFYNIKSGYYAHLSKIYYMDYKHFNGNQTIVSTNDYMNSFRLLPYYGLSTKNWYTEFHAEHHFNGFIMNKIPLVRKLFIHEALGFKALVNDKVDYYYEVNATLMNIGTFLRVDYVWAFKGTKSFGHGFLIGFNTEF